MCVCVHNICISRYILHVDGRCVWRASNSTGQYMYGGPVIALDSTCMEGQ